MAVEECVTGDVCMGTTLSGYCAIQGKCRCRGGLSANSDGNTCELKAPTITGVTDNQELVKQQSYILVCKPFFEGPSYTFKWFKDSDTTPIATSTTYSITSAKETDGGTYKCSVTLTALGNDSPVGSNEIHVKVPGIGPGKECTVATASTVCTGAGYIAECNATTLRCKCNDNYYLKDDKCERKYI
ncbi:unnamed protein product [Lymnaea stagnalis]|uniref:Ig-like domain-containing protein n=1 Tax=Lymnaea stagnalis TaxID=6523 RepID=A0AAV2HCA4_LYMST